MRVQGSGRRALGWTFLRANAVPRASLVESQATRTGWGSSPGPHVLPTRSSALSWLLPILPTTPGPPRAPLPLAGEGREPGGQAAGAGGGGLGRRGRHPKTKGGRGCRGGSSTGEGMGVKESSCGAIRARPLATALWTLYEVCGARAAASTRNTGPRAQYWPPGPSQSVPTPGPGGPLWGPRVLWSHELRPWP